MTKPGRMRNGTFSIKSDGTVNLIMAWRIGGECRHGCEGVHRDIGCQPMRHQNNSAGQRRYYCSFGTTEREIEGWMAACRETIKVLKEV